MSRVTLITGGARSGKSSFALRLAGSASYACCDMPIRASAVGEILAEYEIELSTRQLLAYYLQEPSLEVQRAMLQAFGHRRTSRTCHLLRETLARSQYPSHREAAAHALQRYRPDSSAAAISSLTTNSPRAQLRATTPSFISAILLALIMPRVSSLKKQ